MDEPFGPGWLAVRSRKLMSTYLVALIAVSMFSGMQTMYAEGKDGSFGGGSGTLSDPYIIEDVWDLQNINGNIEAHYALGNDIDASATAGWNGGAGFVPIVLGNENSQNNFKVSLDGRNHTISGLFIDRPTRYGVGLFGSIAPGSSVRNVALAGCDVTGDCYVGGLVGCNKGTVSNCYAEGNVAGTGCVGGLAGVTSIDRGNGFAQTGTAGMILSSGAAGNVTCTGDDAGGLVGENSYGRMTDCYAAANVTGVHYVGGLVGSIWGGRVANSYYPVDAVSVNGGHDLTIGAIHDTQWKDWSSSDHKLNISEYTNLVPSGGCYGIGNVSALQDLLGFAQDTVCRFRQTADLDLSSDHGFFIPYLGAEFDGAGHTISGLDLDMTSASYLGMFGYCGGGTISNTSLVDEKVSGYSSIGGLVGVDDTGTVSASHATGEVTGGDAVGGLVGYVEAGWVNGSSAACAVTGGSQVGGLIGSCCANSQTDITYSYATGDVSGSGRSVGGLLGLGGVYGDGVDNCHATGDVSGTSGVGGLVGDCFHIFSISYSYATGNVTGTNDSVGGLVGMGGYCWDCAVNCHATGNVTGANYVGGLTGSGGGSHSYATGDVTGVDYVGGFVGYAESDISQCFASGDVTGDGDYVGGFAGDISVTVQDSFAWGTVTNSSGTGPYFGGFVGFDHQGKVQNCYSVGAVVHAGGTDPTDKGFAGGVDTGPDYTMKGNFWDKQTSMQTSTSGNATGKTTKAMKTRATFTGAGWDFASVWCIGEGLTYPLLRWQDEAHPHANAGPDQYVDQWALVTFDGNGSSDIEGIVDYTWTFTDGTARTLYGVHPTYRFDNIGVFAITLTVRNMAGDLATDTMTVTVGDITPPVADAGPDLTFDEGTLVTLDGSASTDNAGIANYTWTFTDGAPVRLFGVHPAHLFDNPGVFVVTLNVTDAAGNWDTDTMTMTVNDITLPAARAGADLTIDEGSRVTFNGSGCSDNVGVASYSWSFTDGVRVVLHGVGPSHLFSNPGVFVVTLSIIDTSGNFDDDALTVTVRDVLPPRADAGPDVTVDEGTRPRFNGSGSLDSAGIANYTWRFEYGGEGISLYGPRPSFTFDVPGVYFVELRVWDAVGHWHSDIVTVTVRDIRPPRAEAGPDRTVDEDSLVTLDGSGSSDSAGIASYTWTFWNGTDGTVLHGVSPSFTFEAPGVYTVSLNVTDAAGHWNEDDMVLTVRDVTPPVADAGSDRTVPAGSTVVLDGTNSTDNVWVANCTWTVTYRGMPETLHGAVRSYVFAEGGVYEVVLTVSDASGNIDNNTVIITVVDTGRVSGTVHDQVGWPVEGAVVKVIAFDGKAYTTTTGANGSFALDVHHGPFTWRITKEGYSAISGSSSVSPMNTTVLDLSDKPLVKEGGRGPSTALYLTAAIVIATVVAAAALVLRTRRRDIGPGEG